MYIERLELENIRTFERAKIEFVHPENELCEDGKKGHPLERRPRLPNVNLLLGDNGSGKTTLLQAVALAAFGPAAREAQFGSRNLVRFRADGQPSKARRIPGDRGEIEALLLLHKQDSATEESVASRLSIVPRGELEKYQAEDLPAWDRIYESQNDAFFVVAYGATRRVEPGESLDMGARAKSRFLRAQRVQSVFQDSFSLIPLTFWLPSLKGSNPGRYKQVTNLINRFVGPGHYKFNGEMDGGDYLFERGGMNIPFQSLSDGYRAFIGWVADLLYHVCFGCPSGKKLVENRGIVLVDEIDLHLHPKWQMGVVATVAKALPRMQFIFTSHSPLVAGSLEWMNVLALKLGRENRTSVKRLRESLHGLDADQILLTGFFGLRTTRAAAKTKQLNRLTQRARGGDSEAAKELIAQLARGTEE